MKMIRSMIKWSITVIILWILLILGITAEKSSISNNNSVYDTADSDVSSATMEDKFMEAIPTVRIYRNQSFEILPDSAKFTLTSNSTEANCTFYCKANIPIQWYFKQYDGNIFKNNGISTEVFSKDLNNSTYITFLTLNKATYLDVGKYYCAPVNVKKTLIEKYENSSIYVFVQDETHLIASPDDFDTWLLMEDNNIYIPCQPTSPDVDVKLLLFNKKKISSLTYDEKKFGFLFNKSQGDIIYKCVARKNDRKEERYFTAPIENLVTICDECSEHIVVGQNITLNCSVNPIISGQHMLEWIIPEKFKDQPERIYFDKFNTFKYNRFGSILLSIQNVTHKDNGEIVYRLFYEDNMNNIHIYNQTYKQLVNSTNFLKLNVLSDKNFIIRPAGYQSVKWRVKVVSTSNVELKWKGPGDKKIQTVSEKMRVNTNNGLTELMIRNLQVSDSGVYTLSANNTYEENNTTFTLLVKDLEILPDLSEYILKLNSTKNDRNLTCKGNEPVQWYFEQYDGNLIEKKSYSIKMSSRGQNNNTHYLSLLSLSKATYMDTGYYYCTPVSVKSKSSIMDLKKIYIFIQDEAHLFAIPYDFNTIQYTFSNSIIPCRPTSPEINVSLFIDEKEVTTEYYYNKKVGFMSYGIIENKNYVCNAIRNNFSEHREFNNVDDAFRIYNEDSDYVISGQNVTLNCAVILKYFSVKLNWVFNNKLKNKLEHIKYDNIKKIKLESSYIQLNIQNVSIEDQGHYVCEMQSDIGLRNTTYELKVHELNETYLSLKILDNRNILIRPKGYNSVRWKIIVDARPEANFEWRDPSGNQLNTKSGKISVENDKRSFELTIRDLELNDSGNYTLIARNGKETQKINVTLFVEDKPSIVCLNCSNSEDLYCEVGKICTFEFNISGYPWPNVKWLFKNWTNNTTEGDQSYETIQPISTKNISSIAFKTLITVNITKYGTLICESSNTYGNSKNEYKVSMSDKIKGIEIEGPSIIAAEENITIQCGVSKYNYNNEITWNYPHEDQTKNRVYVTNDQTEFSFYSYLNIKEIRSDFDGTVSCTANRKTLSIGELPETRTFIIEVEDLYAPMINSSSNDVMLEITDKPVEMWCNAVGMPPPSIRWFKNDRPIPPNDTRVQIKNQNRTLVISFPKSEDEGTYTCEVTNKIDKVKLTFYLNENTRISEILLCCMLTIFLIVIVNGKILWISTERKMKKKLAVYHTNVFKKGTINSWNPHIGVEDQAHLLPYDSRWEFPRNKLELGEQIGSGAFGIVYKAKATGILHDDTVTTVAVKMVRSNADACNQAALASELKIMTHLGCHMNIVNILGACHSSSISKKLMVIVEYCCFGSIDRYMQKHKKEFINLITPDGFINRNVQSVFTYNTYENIPSKTTSSETYDDATTQFTSYGHLVSNEIEPEIHPVDQKDFKNTDSEPFSTNVLLCWSYQISKGMEFLASRKILHGDLATRNILLAEKNVVKICDFGLAKNLYKNKIYRKSKKALLPVKWLAIESMRDGIFSTASDVWSFGVVLWEIFSLAAVPYPNVQNDDLLGRLVQGYRMEKPNYSNYQIYNIMLDCWKMESAERPSFTDLIERLGDLLEECKKSHYLKLNDSYMKIYDEKLPSTNVLSLLAKIEPLNNSIVVRVNDTETSLQISESPANTNEFEMKPIVHNACYSNRL